MMMWRWRFAWNLTKPKITHFCVNVFYNKSFHNDWIKSNYHCFQSCPSRFSNCLRLPSHFFIQLYYLFYVKPITQVTNTIRCKMHQATRSVTVWAVLTWVTSSLVDCWMNTTVPSFFLFNRTFFNYHNCDSKVIFLIGT